MLLLRCLVALQGLSVVNIVVLIQVESLRTIVSCALVCQSYVWLANIDAISSIMRVENSSLRLFIVLRGVK